MSQMVFWSKSPSFERDIKKLISLDENIFNTLVSHLDYGSKILEIMNESSEEDYINELSDICNIEREYPEILIRFMKNIFRYYNDKIFDDFEIALSDMKIKKEEILRFNKIFQKYGEMKIDIDEYNKKRILVRKSMPFLESIEISNNIRYEFNKDEIIRQIPFVVLGINTDVGEPFIFQMDIGKTRYLISELTKAYKYSRQLEGENKNV